jgi:hypothetical protein
MNSTLKNILATIGGLLLGGMVNMSIVMISGHVIPPPEGADITTAEGLKASMHLFEPKNFIMPFLAHALGTFVAVLIACYITKTNKMRIPLIISTLFFIGGFTNVMMLPSPLWFSILDLAGAYHLMGYLAFAIAKPKNE